MRLLLPILGSLWLLGSPALAQDQRQTSHDRELLEAQVGALIERLGRRVVTDPLQEARRDSQRMKGLSIKAAATREQEVAGIALVQLSVSIDGRPEYLQSYIGQKLQAGLTATPPLKINRSGILNRLEFSLWCLRGDKFNSRASNTDLMKLRDNLLWIEAQQQSLPVLMAIVQAISEAETVRVDSASWQSNTLRLSGRANDKNARMVFEKEIRSRTARFSRPLKVLFESWETGVPTVSSGPGLDLQDADLADAIMMLSEVTRRNVVFASRKPSRVSVSIRSEDSRKLHDHLLANLNSRENSPGTIMVAGPELLPDPPNANMFPEEPISLMLRNGTPGYLLALLADASRVGLVPASLSELNISVLVRDQSIRQVAQAASWALGLRFEGTRKLLATVPAKSLPVESGQPDDILVDLYAADAPLSLLVRALVQPPQKRICLEPDPDVTLRLRRIPRQRLLELLLASHGARHAASDKIPGCRDNKPGRQRLRLAAVYREGRRARALVEHQGRLSWLDEGNKLTDGTRIRRIFSSRVLLKSPSGRTESLALHLTKDRRGQGIDFKHRPDTLGVAISRLRLAGTVVLADGAAALLIDPDGNSFLVKPGHPLGRRCGKVTEVHPGAVTVELGCPNPFDARLTRLFFNPNRQID